MDEAVRTVIEEKIKSHPIVVFMKGTKNFPQCGFSASVVEVFKRLGASIHDVNVLADPTIRQGIKDFSNWPTIPQVYINGKFVGGRDIIVEMYESQELQPLVEAAAAK
ncbi:MAG: Grx4 family monothiol glutaredoxin [Sandaracinaceae bacterium]|jgi:monothiol glutaredoxin|nr:Grx4 family monothiol glutaredoxin [Sandaracinaceae bacterium]